MHNPLLVALVRVVKPYKPCGGSPTEPSNTPVPTGQLAALQDAGTSLAALLGAPVLLGVADNLIMGMNVHGHALSAPTAAGLQQYFSWLMYSNAIQLMANKTATVKKKLSAFDRLGEFIATTGRHVLQATPQDVKAYLGMWSSTAGCYRHAGLQLCAPVSAKCVVSYLATEFDRHPATSGSWNLATATGSAGPLCLALATNFPPLSAPLYLHVYFRPQLGASEDMCLCGYLEVYL